MGSGDRLKNLLEVLGAIEDHVRSLVGAVVAPTPFLGIDARLVETGQRSLSDA
jgi:hypothetical protein